MKQRAAGLVIYGPHVAFVFTTGAGVHMATLDPDTNDVSDLERRSPAFPRRSNEFAINASNSRHWPKPVRAYIEDCLEGDEGPRGRNFNMRWVGSMVADVYRILDPRRRLSLSGRLARGLRATAACGCSMRPTRSRS